MKKSVTLWRVVVLSGLLLTLTAERGAASSHVMLPGGTVVPVHLAAVLSSSTAQTGQRFRILTAAPVVVGGWVAVQRGAAGQGTVQAASPAGKSGRQGTLSITFDWVYGTDGTKVPLAAIARNQAGKNKTGSSNAANVGATLLLGPVGLFAHNFIKGHDINVPTSQVFKAYVGRAVAVVSSQTYSSH